MSAVYFDHSGDWKDAVLTCWTASRRATCATEKERRRVGVQCARSCARRDPARREGERGAATPVTSMLLPLVLAGLVPLSTPQQAPPPPVAAGAQLDPLAGAVRLGADRAGLPAPGSQPRGRRKRGEHPSEREPAGRRARGGQRGRARACELAQLGLAWGQDGLAFQAETYGRGQGLLPPLRVAQV